MIFINLIIFTTFSSQTRYFFNAYKRLNACTRDHVFCDRVCLVIDLRLFSLSYTDLVNQISNLICLIFFFNYFRFEMINKLVDIILKKNYVVCLN